MTGLLLPILGLAIVDGINPSALLATFVLLGQPSPGRRVLVYVSGVFSTYLALGVTLMLGLDLVIGSVGVALESPMAYAAQLAIGLVLLAYAIAAPDRPSPGSRLNIPSSGQLPALFLLGAGVTILELSTALPYFGAIALMTAAGLSIVEWLPLLVLYNVVFVLPPLGVLAAHRLLGSRIERRLERSRDGIRRGARQTLLWILGIVGFLLAADAAVYFVGLP